MKSNVCKIEKGKKDLKAILEESERVALCNGFTHKQGLQLRLICEEMDGMLPNIIDDFDGEFWIEYEKGVCKVNASVEFAEFTVEKKKDLINISKNKKNVAARGIVGKIRSALEDLFLDSGNTQAYGVSQCCYMTAEYVNCLDYTQMWSLEQYRETIRKENRSEDWDELEKSIIASLADDVIVGVKGRNAHIIIIKKFA